MPLFHMQLHPNEPGEAVNYAIAALQHNPPAIGLDFDAGPEFNQGLNMFGPQDFINAQDAHIQLHGNQGVMGNLQAFYNLQCGDVGLIRGGATPVALVRIIGNYAFEPNPPPNDPHWFRHRFPVEVIGWYEQDLALYPQIAFVAPLPAQGTFQILNNPNTPTYQSVQHWLQLKEAHMRFAALESAITNFRNLILTGPPGTGKTLSAKLLTAYMLTGRVPEINGVDTVLNPLRMPFIEGQPGAWDIVQFHPSYNYDDFVRGIRIRTNEQRQTEYTVKNGPLLRMAENAAAQPGQKFILIIDEINRANVAAVLGEMIYALEYRGGEERGVALQYGDGDARAHLPKNLYIIGTMNTADRSIGHIDYAVRRRFAFDPLHPDRSVVEASHQDANLRDLALAKFDAVAALFTGEQALLSADYRAEDVQPGHSYFLVKDEDAENGEDAIRRQMKYQVGPLLREYVADGVLKTDAIQRIRQIEGGA